MTIIVIPLLFIYFFLVSYSSPARGIVHSLFFFTFYLFTKLYFGFAGNIIFGLWTDAVFLGLTFPVLSKIVFVKSSDDQLLFKILSLNLWGWYVVFLTIIDNRDIMVGFKYYREIFLYSAIAYISYIAVKRECNASKSIFNGILIVSSMAIVFSIIELFYLNIMRGSPFNLIWVRNYAPYLTAAAYIKPQIGELFGNAYHRGFGVLVNPHASAHFLLTGFICYFCLSNFAKMKKAYGKMIYIALFCSIFVVFAMFIKTAWALMFGCFLYLVIVRKKTPVIPILGLIFMAASIFAYMPDAFSMFLGRTFLGKSSFIPFVLREPLGYFLENNIFTLITGNGFTPQTSGSTEMFIIRLTNQIGIIGIILLSRVVIVPLFFSFEHLYKFENAQYIVYACKLIIIAGCVSTIHFPVVKSYGNLLIFYVSVGILYGLRYWDRRYAHNSQLFKMERNINWQVAQKKLNHS